MRVVAKLMKCLGTIGFVLIYGLGFSQEVLQLNGVYRGSNLFVQNPYDIVQKLFCVTSIGLNGKSIIDSPKSTAVLVNLENLTVNETVALNIAHKTGCLPKVLNPEVIKQGSDFSFIQILIDQSTISWVTTGEFGESEYILEKLKYEEWIPQLKIKGKGNLHSNQYSVGIKHYSGENKFRLIYVQNGNKNQSDVFDFYSPNEAITFFPVEDIENWIALTKSTDYKIKNEEGEIVKEGDGMNIIVEDLPSGEYILMIENREEQFYKPVPEPLPPPVRRKRSKRIER